MPLKYPQFREALSPHTTNGMVRDHEAYILYRIADTLPAQAVAIEIGCWKGKSSISICWGLDNFNGIENKPGWEKGAEVKKAFERNIATANATAYCTLHDMSSGDFSNHWNQDVDFVFIDGCHLYDAARFDIFAFMKFVKPGGWVAFHDIGMKESVVRAILEFLEQYPKWDMEAVAWDNNLLALKRASNLGTAKPRWYLKLILGLAPLACATIPPSDKPFQKIYAKLMQSLARFIFRKISLISKAT
jgi:hypothetical protein